MSGDSKQKYSPQKVVKLLPEGEVSAVFVVKIIS